MPEKEHDLSVVPDEVLVSASCKGDTDSITELIRRYMPRIRFKAAEYGIAQSDRDDLIQEGLIGLLNAIRSYDVSQNASFRTYCNICIRNKMLVELEKRKSDKYQALQNYLLLEDLEQSDGVANEEKDPFRIVALKEERELLMEKARSLLSNLEQETLSLYLSGHSYKEMAEELNLSVKAVDNALQRIRRKLREG